MLRAVLLVAVLACGLAQWETATAAPNGNASSVFQVKVEVKTNYYTIVGSNSYHHVREALAQARPWKRTEPFDAITDWKVNWSYRSAWNGPQLRIANGRITTRVTITMPQVKFGKDAPPELVQWWREYLQNLVHHELGHVSLARQATAALHNEFMALASFGSRGELEAAADSAASRTVDLYVEKEKEYDRSTAHGPRHFPPRPSLSRHGEGTRRLRELPREGQ